MGLQLILCLETSEKANIDYLYVKEVLERFYLHSEEINFTPIYLEGKCNYNHSKTVRRIKEKTNMYKSIGKTEVIYFLDKDKHALSYIDSKHIEDVTKYCENRKYEIVWFVETIEEVFVGAKIKKRDKQRTAIKFKINSMISDVREKKLNIENPLKSKTSNILNVLDRHLQRK